MKRSSETKIGGISKYLIRAENRCQIDENLCPLKLSLWSLLLPNTGCLDSIQIVE